VYALMRVVFNIFGVSLPVAWILTTLGIVSMIIGAFLALGQWDLKRLLAYSSISQLGYVVLGIGLGGLIISRGGSPTWASLALLGGLFHLINHSVYKSLLFLTSGSIEMSTGTRQLQQMGGLAGKLPFTRATCTVASASIAGVPPFSGFWSKLIMVIAAVQARFIWVAAIIVFVSVCTLIMYLKVQRYVFLGELPDSLRNIKEERGSMVVAMIVLAVLCVCMGLLVLVPALKINILDPAVKVLIDGLGYSARMISTGSM
jgi:multicomponent Na+:H+ antiporter subunit D